MATKKARQVRKGDIIKYTSASGQEFEEVVRDVNIFLMMANGENVPLLPTEDVVVIPQEELDEPVEGDSNE